MQHLQHEEGGDLFTSGRDSKYTDKEKGVTMEKDLKFGTCLTPFTSCALKFQHKSHPSVAPTRN